MATRSPIAVGEWYHCYGRGVDKRKVFLVKKDYERFLLLMYVGNGTNAIHISNLKDKDFLHALSSSDIERGVPIVEIDAYCLMPNHFHFLIKEIREGGLALFMQKIMTGYTMYFNKKNDRTGSLFSGTYKSKHIVDDRYIKQVVSYIHCNPIELYEPNWKEFTKTSLLRTKQILSAYPYSSFQSFIDMTTPEKKLLGDSIFTLYDTKPSIEEMLKQAKDLYQEENIKV